MRPWGRQCRNANRKWPDRFKALSRSDALAAHAVSSRHRRRRRSNTPAMERLIEEVKRYRTHYLEGHRAL